MLRALEGSLDPVEWFRLSAEEGCSASENCVTKYVWQKINDSINQTVDSIMLDQLVEEVSRNAVMQVWSSLRHVRIKIKNKTR